MLKKIQKNQPKKNVKVASPKKSEVELSIIMPCLNEEKTLAICIDKAQDFIRRHKIKGEVVIGDNGSTDASIAIAKKKGCRVVNIPKRGYGAALYGAAMTAQGRYIIMGDSDDSYDFSKLEYFIEKLRLGFDLVMGNRFKGGIMPGAMPWKNRYIGNPILSFIGRILFRSAIKDFHCGLRGFSKEAFLKMDLKTIGMEFASEMVIKATLHKMKICEVPTVLHIDGRDRAPHLRPWRDGWRHLRFMLLYSPKWLFVAPGLFLFFGGMTLLALLIPHSLKIGSVLLDIHTMVYAAGMVIVGYQAIFFGVAVKEIAKVKGIVPVNDEPKTISLELWLILGAVLSLVGIAISIVALQNWQAHDFGNLDPKQTMRYVVVAIVSMILGVQIIFSNLFLSSVKIKIR